MKRWNAPRLDMMNSKQKGLDMPGMITSGQNIDIDAVHVAAGRLLGVLERAGVEIREDLSIQDILTLAAEVILRQAEGVTASEARVTVQGMMIAVAKAERATLVIAKQRTKATREASTLEVVAVGQQQRLPSGKATKAMPEIVQTAKGSFGMTYGEHTKPKTSPSRVVASEPNPFLTDDDATMTPHAPMSGSRRLAIKGARAEWNSMGRKGRSGLAESSWINECLRQRDCGLFRLTDGEISELRINESPLTV